MKIAELCSTRVTTVEPKASLREAALLMRNAHVGALVVVDRADGIGRPVGILTDRDIVVAVIAVPGADPESIRVCDAMSTPVVTVGEEHGALEAVQAMRARGVRRLPVVALNGGLAGMVTSEDVLDLISGELAGMAEAMRRAHKREASDRARLDIT